MAKAIWNGVILAESETYEMVEGNVYFPATSINKAYFQQNQSTSICPWKGTANYYNLVVEGQINKDAAWTYPNPKPAAAQIKDHIAFWGGVQVEK